MVQTNWGKNTSLDPKITKAKKAEGRGLNGTVPA
jgi:hypothetical protein